LRYSLFSLKNPIQSRLIHIDNFPLTINTEFPNIGKEHIPGMCTKKYNTDINTNTGINRTQVTSRKQRIMYNATYIPHIKYA